MEFGLPRISIFNYDFGLNVSALACELMCGNNVFYKVWSCYPCFTHSNTYILVFPNAIAYEGMHDMTNKRIETTRERVNKPREAIDKFLSRNPMPTLRKVPGSLKTTCYFIPKETKSDMNSLSSTQEKQKLKWLAKISQHQPRFQTAQRRGGMESQYQNS